MTHRLLLLAALLGALIVPATASAASSEALPGEVLATGLDNPRGLIQAPGGVVYVAEAGRGGDGPCIERAGRRLCIGATGAVTRVRKKRKVRILKGLPSLANPDGSQAIGPNDVARKGKQVFTIVGLGGRTSERAQLGELGGRLGWLFEARDGTAFPIADVAGHAGPDALSYPFGMAWAHKKLYVADSGANSVVEVARGGALKTAVQLAARTITRDGQQVDIEPVPSAIGAASKGRLYVAEATSYPWLEDESRVLRVTGAQAKVFQREFTNLIDIVPAGFGSLYVLEGTQGAKAGRRSGRIMHMEPGGQVRHVLARGLPAPGSLAVDPLTGKLLVTLNADKPGEGALVRLPGHGTSHASVGTPQGQYPDMTKATKRGLREARRLWKATLKRERRFQFARARAAGFRFTSSKPPPRPGVFHLRRDKFDSDGKEMDPRWPESLVYYNTSKGKKILVAFMYRAETQRFPLVTRGLLGWHRHGASARALPMTHVWMTGDIRSAMANCLPVPELEKRLNWKFEGSSNRVSGLESLPCGKPGDIIEG